MGFSALVMAAAACIRGVTQVEPGVAVILGSGLGAFAEEVREATAISYADIPGFPRPTVEGHPGVMVFGALEGKRVLVMRGRFHYYEGHKMQELGLPVRLAWVLGCRTLIVTNAAGAINRQFRPGDLMVITDHVNLMGDNPLIGEYEAGWGPRFPDMSEAYSRELVALAERVGGQSGVRLRRGVYVAVAGPSYETPAEIEFLRRMGADAVGMSTVPEVIVASQLGMKVLGVSCITNMAASHRGKRLSHLDVLTVTSQVAGKMRVLLRGVIRELPSSASRADEVTPGGG